MGKQNGYDWVLILLALVSMVSILLFIVTSGISLPLFDVSIEWSGSGFTITPTGIAEIIVAIGFGIGAVIRARQEKFNPSER